MTPETLERLIALLRLLEQCHLMTKKEEISRGYFEYTQYAGYYICICFCLYMQKVTKDICFFDDFRQLRPELSYSRQESLFVVHSRVQNAMVL